VGEGRSGSAPSIAMMADRPICESAFLLEGICKPDVSKVGVY
jgi:hypothetical protein